MSLVNKVTQFIQDADITHAIVHGDENTTVQTEGGPVRTFAKLLADGLGFLTRLAKSDGSSQIGHGGGTVQSVLDALQLPDYAALRAYAGDRRMVYVTGYLATSAPSGIAGLFIRDDKDAATVDNGGTVIVSASGVRWKRSMGLEVRPEWFGAIGDNVADDYASLQAALDFGGIINLGLKIFKTTRPLTMTKRQTRLLGSSLQATYIILQMAVVDKGNWAAGTAYAVNDLVRNTDGLPFVCKTAHVAGAGFAADWAAAKWELYTVISVRASDCECANFYAPVPAKAVGIAVQGCARFNMHHVNLAPRDNSSGVGLVMDDRNYLGTFSPGSYTHMIGPCNLIAATTQGVRQFEYGIYTAGTPGGINATRIVGNHIVGDQAVWLTLGGGNFVLYNLVQSFTGGNSGTRPFTGGYGYGVYYGGSLHASCNYFERFEIDFKSTGNPDANLEIMGHSQDASIFLQDPNGGELPGFASTNYGVSALKFDDLKTNYALTGNNQVITTRLAGRYVTGGGVARIGITLDAAGAKDGQLFVLKNNSWPFELVPGATADLGQAGNSLLIGQQGANVGGDQTACDLAVFMFSSGKWTLIAAHWYGPGADTYRSYPVNADNVQVPITARTMMLSGAGAGRVGATLALGAKYGQRVTLCGNSWPVTFSTAGVKWLNNAAPTFGDALTQVAASELVYTASGWYELSRNTRQ